LTAFIDFEPVKKFNVREFWCFGDGTSSSNEIRREREVTLVKCIVNKKGSGGYSISYNFF
jgi:hypothetical protein